MRRLGLIVTVVGAAGCSAVRDAVTAHRAAGTAAGRTLTVERLAALVGNARRIPVRPEVVSGVATVYLDYALVAAALARGRDLRDSALTLAAEWPLVAELRWQRLHDSLAAARGPVSPAQADSAYRAGTVRLFQHILIRVAPGAAPVIADQKRRAAEDVLRRARAGGGAAFAALARRYSEDPGSQAGGGYLPVTERGRFVPAFDSAAWALAPGAMSGVVRSPFGFHIIRRPAFAEVRDAFRAGLEHARGARLDAAYLDSLAAARALRVERDAPKRLREALARIVPARTDPRPLATFRGGAFRVKDFALWALALDPTEVRTIAAGDDSLVAAFVRALAQRAVVLEELNAAGVPLAAADWERVRADHDSTITRLEELTGLTPRLLRDSAASERDRMALAMARVDRYLDRSIVAGAAPFIPVSPFLAAALRAGEPWSLDEAGLARALARARAIRAHADSAAGGPAGPPGPPTPPGLRPAPGPPPAPPR
jgi:peptidyl-prolyl cis-trans isomerase D